MGMPGITNGTSLAAGRVVDKAFTAGALTRTHSVYRTTCDMPLARLLLSTIPDDSRVR